MEPKFKVGDRVKETHNANPEFVITAIREPGGYRELGRYYAEGDVNGRRVWFKHLELVTPATPEFAEGDLVEAVKGETAIRGRIGGGEIVEAGWGLPDLYEEGFRVSLVEAAKPVLPTEPGWYLDSQNVPWRLSRVGHWHAAAKNSEPLALWEAELLIQGTTRLVPEVKDA